MHVFVAASRGLRRPRRARNASPRRSRSAAGPGGKTGCPREPALFSGVFRRATSHLVVHFESPTAPARSSMRVATRFVSRRGRDTARGGLVSEPPSASQMQCLAVISHRGPTTVAVHVCGFSGTCSGSIFRA